MFSPIVDAGYVNLYGRDITERKQMEEEIRKVQERFSGIYKSSKDAIAFATLGGVLLDVNNSFCKLTGYSKEELLSGRRYQDITPKEFHEYEAKIIERILTTGSPGEYEKEYMRKDGSRVPILLTTFVVKGNDGQPIGVAAIIKDITERKQAEEALRESEERYRALVNLGGKVGEAVIMVQDTEQGNAIQAFVSNEWPHITGYSGKELLGMSFFDLLHPKHQEVSLKRHKRKMSGAIIPGLFEMSIITKDGTEVPIELTSAYTTYKGQRATVAFIRDITERKQAEERERELQQELYHASRLASIGELAAGVAHEISNPLTGILGFSQRLMRKSTDEEVSRDLERINSEAQRVAKVVGNLLTFARRREPKKEYLDINDILQRALELRAYALETSNIEVVTSLAPGLPRTMADFHQIQEVFLNIILNAEQAMSEASGGGKLSVKTQRTGDYIRISFADDGPGIPVEHFDKVFDPFFTTRGEKGGTGLGLSLCHGIVTEHAGKIYAKSKPGKGATFFVELPLSPIGASFDHKY
jgi:PAS domain S-box-containing protein